MKNRIFSASRRDYWAVVLNNDTPMPDAPAAPSPSPSSMTPIEPTPASTADQMQCCTHCKKSFDVSHFLREQVPGHGNMYYRTQAGGNGLRSWGWCHRCHDSRVDEKGRWSITISSFRRGTANISRCRRFSVSSMPVERWVARVWARGLLCWVAAVR
jgi:hypothetical protein